MIRIKKISSQIAGTAISDVMTTSMAEEAENASSADDNRACSNRGSREDKDSNGVPLTEDRGCSKKPLCNGSR